MYDALQNVLLLAFAIVWFGGMITLFVRFRAEQRKYLHHFPSNDRYHTTLDMYMDIPGLAPTGTLGRLWKVMTETQDDPELEQLRREMWRRYRRLVLWLFGFPLVTFGLVALVIVLFIDPGIVHLT